MSLCLCGVALGSILVRGNCRLLNAWFLGLQEVLYACGLEPCGEAHTGRQFPWGGIVCDA